MTKQQNKKNLYFPVCIALGTLVGIVTDNIGMWLAIGVALGCSLGYGGSKKDIEDNKNND